MVKAAQLTQHVLLDFVPMACAMEIYLIIQHAPPWMTVKAFCASSTCVLEIARIKVFTKAIPAIYLLLSTLEHRILIHYQLIFRVSWLLLKPTAF